MLTELKYFKDLWSVVISYIKKRKAWWTGRLQSYNSDEMLESTTQWNRTIQQLLRTALITAHAKPNELLNFVKGELDTIKEYIPVIVALRTRGLERRHFE